MDEAGVRLHVELTRLFVADIFNNLHGKYQKTNIVKALERLVDQDEVVSKTYGKISIYVVKQVTI